MLYTEPLPRGFDMLQYFETIFLLWKNKMRYILGVVALLEACDSTNNGRHFGRHLEFYQKLKIRLKPREMFFFFCALHEKIHIVSILPDFSHNIYFYC